jgi:pimeloyl-ACP methyl ester carboxylesterase
MSPIQPEPTIVLIETAGVRLTGELAMTPEMKKLVVFVHGSGSSRLSPRNRSVASALNAAGLGTLLFDLLTPEEERIDRTTRHLRFDIGLLSARVMGAVQWLRSRPWEMTDAPLGLFGASTGAAAALVAAAKLPDVISAVVSRGGRPDLAGDVLSQVKAPTLLIVGSQDPQVLGLNRIALTRMPCARSLHLVHGATHLFEEPGALDEVIQVTTRWFHDWLRQPHAWQVGGASAEPPR